MSRIITRVIVREVLIDGQPHTVRIERRGITISQKRHRTHYFTPWGTIRTHGATREAGAEQVIMPRKPKR